MHLFHSFGATEGLTNVSVTAVAQDPDGFLWVGTEYGLFRLEGDHFRGFEEKDGLPSRRVVFGGLASGVDRGLWVVTSLGLTFWDGHRFRPPSSVGGVQGLDGHTGVPLNQGGAILSDAPHQTRYLSLNGEPFQALTGLPWGNGLTAGTCAPGRDLLVLALGQELWVRQKGAWTHRDFAPLMAENISSVLVDDQGRIVFRSSEHLGRLTRLEDPVEWLATASPLSMINTVGLGQDSHGRLWTNTAQGVLWLQDGQSGFLGEAEGLPPGGADILRVDRQGMVWIAGEGVHKLLGQGRWTGYTRHQGLPTDVVWSIARSRDGYIWAGTAAGLARGDNHGWKLLPHTRSNQVMDLAEDNDGNLWAAHQRSQERPVPLSVRPAGKDELRPVAVPEIPAPGSVTSVYPDGSGLWLASTNQGLLRAERQGLRLTQVHPVAIADWPKDTNVNRICPAPGGGFWVGSSNGLAHWDGHSWAVLRRVSPGPDSQADEVMSLAPMAQAQTWCSFREALAVCRVQRQGNRLVVVETIQPPHPLLKQPVISLANAADGALWLGTSGGLLRWKDGHIQAFGKTSGFPGEDCCQNALLFDGKHDVWVGVSVGLVHGQGVADLPIPVTPAAAILEAVRADGVSLLHSAGERQVPWRTRTLTFGYCASGTAQVEGVSYQVRLLGLEDAWRSTKLPEARYPGLSSGSYQFEVRTVSATGELGGLQALAFTVLPPWWQHKGLWVLATLALAGATTSLHRRRTALLRTRNARLEELIQERTGDLLEANKALQEASLVDPLTGLRNRRFLEVSVEEESLRVERIYKELIAQGLDPQSEKEAMVFFMLDLDHFKAVNDQYGHPAGDAVLVQFAEVLRAATRASDSLIRWGGEEFLVVAKRARRADAVTIAQNLLDAIRRTEFLLPGGELLKVTCSIGLVPFPVHPSCPDLGSWRRAVDVADQCLFAAKRSGRNRWVGAFVRAETPAEPYAGLEAWDVPWALERGLMETRCSEPDFRWVD